VSCTMDKKGLGSSTETDADSTAAVATSIIDAGDEKRNQVLYRITRGIPVTDMNALVMDIRFRRRVRDAKGPSYKITRVVVGGEFVNVAACGDTTDADDCVRFDAVVEKARDDTVSPACFHVLQNLGMLFLLLIILIIMMLLLIKKMGQNGVCRNIFFIYNLCTITFLLSVWMEYSVQ